MDGWFFSKHPNLWCRWAQSSPPPSPPSSSSQRHFPPTPTPLWMGSLGERKKKSSLDFEGWHFKWSWGSYKGGKGWWNTDINSHAKTGRLKVIISYLLKESQRETGHDPSRPLRLFLMLWLVKFVQPHASRGGRYMHADIQTICRMPLLRLFFNCSQKRRKTIS